MQYIFRADILPSTQTLHNVLAEGLQCQTLQDAQSNLEGLEERIAVGMGNIRLYFGSKDHAMKDQTNLDKQENGFK